MGVHIIVKKVVDKTMEKTWGGESVPYYKTEEQQWWDGLRYGGDKDFILENDFECYDESDDLVRPKDFENCRLWVKDNIQQGGQLRLLEVLDKMEKDLTLVFRFSW